METITLANGRVFEGAHAIKSENNLFVYITEGEYTLTEIVTLFENPENVRTISADRYGEKTTYEGYTELYAVSKEYDNINLVLKKEV